MNNDLIFTGKKNLQYYNGLLIRADLNLHSQVAETVEKLIPKGSLILDLGCGQGAMSSRLKDLGYDVTAVDVNKDDFQFAHIPYFCVDFNNAEQRSKFENEFANRFDLVIGLEVIEHVENHWDYVRLLKSLVKEGGYILVSTPNVTSWYSRINFLFFGQFHQFSADDLSYGHISPVTSWHLQNILEVEGLKEIEIKPAGTLPAFYLPNFSSLSIAYNLINVFFYPFMRKIKKGWCLIATARK